MADDVHVFAIVLYDWVVFMFICLNVSHFLFSRTGRALYCGMSARWNVPPPVSSVHSDCRQPNRRHQDHPIHSLSKLVIQIEVIVLGPAAKAAPQHVLGDDQQHGPPGPGNLASAVPALPLTCPECCNTHRTLRPTVRFHPPQRSARLAYSSLSQHKRRARPLP